MTQPSLLGDASDSRWRFSLADAFWWFVLASAYFGILAALPVMFESFRDDAPPRAGVLATSAGCWLLLLAFYVRQRRAGALIVHIAPVAVVLIAIGLTRDVYYSRGAAVVLAAGALGAAASFPLLLAKELSQAGLNRASPATNLLAHLVGGVVLTVLLLAAVPSIALGGVFTPGVVFGAILGFWLGLYQSAATSPPVAQARLFGFSVRALAIGGLAGGLLGPLIHLVLTYCLLLGPLFPMRYSPLFGIPVALFAGVCSWSRPPGRLY